MIERKMPRNIFVLPLPGNWGGNDLLFFVVGIGLMLCLICIIVFGWHCSVQPMGHSKFSPIGMGIPYLH